MKHRYLILAIVAPLLLGACGIFKFGVGKVQDESEYKSVKVMEDGRTLLFTYNIRKVKREPIGLGWERRIIYLRDVHYLCATDLKTNKTRILLELQNDRRGLPYDDLVVGDVRGSKAMVSYRRRNDVGIAKQRQFLLFDEQVFHATPKKALRVLKDVNVTETDPRRQVNLVARDGTLLLQDEFLHAGRNAQRLSLWSPWHKATKVGESANPLSFVCQDYVCFRDLENRSWHAISVDTGAVTALKGSPPTAGPLRGQPDVRAVKRPEHGSDHLLVWRRQEDGSHTEEQTAPHQTLLR